VLVKVAPGVHFDRLTYELFLIADAYWYACMVQGITGMITGAQDKVYREDGAHRAGRALDLRSRDFRDPFGAADMIRRILESKGMDVVVLFGPPDHLNHIHVHYTVRATA
jgi:LmbE family N-acetylglucosaminyl deacetylase